MRNIEIKAKLRDPEFVIAKAKTLTDSECVVLKQRDTFFNVKEGRFKLRQFDDGSGELIYYERPNVKGPKLCEYKKTTVAGQTVDGLRDVLSSSNGVLGEVKKTRRLYQIGQTRLHIDDVDDLGNFLELEVALNDDETIEDGEKIARDLMAALKVEQEDLITGAYMDLLLKR